VLDRIVKCCYTNHELRASILKSGVFLKKYDSTHGMPAGYAYELEADADFSDLLDMFKYHGIWTVKGLDIQTRKRHMDELAALYGLVCRESKTDEAHRDLVRSEMICTMCASL
jgi:hypothetical protein